jgi:hypothetical protein
MPYVAPETEETSGSAESGEAESGKTAAVKERTLRNDDETKLSSKP